MPGEFLAEEDSAGLLGAIGERELQQACAAFAEANPELTVRVLQAYEKARAWAKENPDGLKALLVRDAKITDDVAKLQLTRNDFAESQVGPKPVAAATCSLRAVGRGCGRGFSSGFSSGLSRGAAAACGAGAGCNTCSTAAAAAASIRVRDMAGRGWGGASWLTRALGGRDPSKCHPKRKPKPWPALARALRCGRSFSVIHLSSPAAEVLPPCAFR